MKYVFLRTRSIVVNDAGITALVFGRPWKTHPWREIQRIERLRWYTVTGPVGYELHIEGADTEIIMDYTIGGFNALLADLTERAQQHQIELWTRDRGPDTYKKTKAEVTDPQERKRLLKSGVLKKVESLVV